MTHVFIQLLTRQNCSSLLGTVP